MPNDELTGLLKEFKVRAEKDLTKARTDGKQTRSLVVGPPKLVTLTADKCKKLCEKAGLEYGDGYENRVLEYITTNEKVDRYGDIVRNKEMDFTTNYFPNNPVIMYIHNYRMHPIGNSIKIWRVASEKVIRAQGVFADPATDITWISELAFRMSKAGFMRACSIGFLPVKWNSPKTQEERDKLGLGKWGIEYVESEYLEWSPCGIPANPGALNNYLKKFEKDLSFDLFDQEILDKMLEVKIFPDDNTLDIFSEYAKKKVDLTIVTPEIKVEETETYLIEYVKEGNTYTEEVKATSWEDAESKAGENANVVGILVDMVPFNKEGKEIKLFQCEFMNLGFKCCCSRKATSWEEAQKAADASELTDELVVGVLDIDLKLLDREGNEIGKAGDLIDQKSPLFSALEVKLLTLDDEDKFCEHFNVTDVKDVKELEVYMDEVVKPYPNEHACRLSSPKKYDKFRRGTRKHNGKTYSVIFGKLKGKNTWEQQAFRYAKDTWTVADAKKHCKDHKGISFEPASGKATASAQPTGENVTSTPITVNINLDLSELTNAIKEFTKAVNIVDKSKPEAQQAAASVVDEEDYTNLQLDELDTDINI